MTSFTSNKKQSKLFIASFVLQTFLITTFKFVSLLLLLTIRCLNVDLELDSKNIGTNFGKHGTMF